MTSNENKFEPGAARLGNFINYYDFHSPKERLQVLSRFIENLDLLNTRNEHILCLDVGCNTGELTKVLYEHLSSCLLNSRENSLKEKKCYMLGVDIDPVLIERAEEGCSNSFITFRSANVLDNEFKVISESFLTSHSAIKFDIIFLFSVTMWIHLNHGDTGLRNFLIEAAKQSDTIVLEPQPWKSYKSANRRMKKLKQEMFPFWEDLRMRESVEDDVEQILITECGMRKLFETPKTPWGRKITCYRR